VVEEVEKWFENQYKWYSKVYKKVYKPF
jgi:hypothetical protein